MKIRELFEEQSSFLKSREEIEAWLQSMKIENYTINDDLSDDLSVDVKGDVDLFSKGLTSFPVQFGNVDGYFACTHNKLTSLQGGPREVGGDFQCSGNQLTTLQGGPREVGGDFWCYDNELTSLQGGPREVGGNFLCQLNRLTSLEGIGNVEGDIRADKGVAKMKQR